MPNELFCERLRSLRKQARMTQEAVAKELRIHRSTYTKYECGVVSPDQQGLVQLAQLFGVSADYLLGNDKGDAAHISRDDPGAMNLSIEEQQLVQMFRQLTAAEQNKLVQQAQKAFKQRK